MSHVVDDATPWVTRTALLLMVLITVPNAVAQSIGEAENSSRTQDHPR
jgi:hypothetical protein